MTATDATERPTDLDPSSLFDYRLGGANLSPSTPSLPPNLVNP